MDTVWLAPIWSHSPSHRLAGEQRTACGAKLPHYIPSNREGRRKCRRCLSLSAPADSVGPFPQEPAPGSPEAVAQAAETLRSRVLDSAERDEVLDLLDGHRDAFEKREDELLAEVERLKLREAMLVNANREIREQRDELVKALAEVKARFGRWVRTGVAAGDFGRDRDMLSIIESALRKAGR